MSELSEKIVAEIKEKKILPLPKWTFLLRNSVIWALFGVNVTVGAVAVAVFTFLMVNSEGGEIARIQDLFLYVPYFWLGIIGVFCFIAYHNFLHTEGGYRFHTLRIALLSVGISLLFGFLLYFAGFAARVNLYLSSTVPYYTTIADRRAYIWAAPESGRLAGIVLEVDSPPKSMSFRDLNNKVWQIDLSEATVRGGVALQKNEIVKILGTQTGPSTFKATEFRPMNGMGAGMMQGNGRMMRNTR